MLYDPWFGYATLGNPAVSWSCDMRQRFAKGNTGFSELAALPPECQAMRRCRRSARRFAPLLALASAGDPRRPRPGSAALGGGWLALWRHEERPPYRGPCVRLGGQHHLLLSSLFHLRFLLRITQHNRIRRNILANRLVTTVQPLPQGHI